MLGSGNFAFETPNVIDEGDLPPSPPSRYNISTAISADDQDYQEARESAQRLLNDINDLELAPFSNKSRLPFRDFPSQQDNKPYDPYRDDITNDRFSTLENENHHSLPSSAEGARMHASFLLQQQQMRKPVTPSPLGRTLKLSAPLRGTLPRSFHNGNNSAVHFHGNGHGDSKHLVRQRLVSALRGRLGCWIMVVVVVIAMIVGIVVSVGNHPASSNSSSVSGTNDGASTPTSIPNFAGTARYNDLVQLLSQRGVSSRDDLSQYSRSARSPQNAAVNWMAGVDALQLAVDNPRLIQRYVLAVLYFATDNNPESTKLWTNRFSFTTDTDECSWHDTFQVQEYVSDQVAMGVSCNEQLYVSSIFLPDNGVTGGIPTELQYLPQLTVLALHNNAITGSIPHQLGNLQNLLYLNFNNNAITGSIPVFLGDLPDLLVLGLGYNQLKGKVPVSMGTAARLKSISISQNLLTGTLDFASHLSNLQYFYAANNQFTGKIEQGFFTYISEMREFDISNNQLSGKIPLDSLFHEQNLYVLDLANNNFTGTFPEISAKNVALHYLNLRNNQLNGHLPESLSNLAELQRMDLQDNLFTGLIPNALGRCHALTYLFLGGNKFVDDMLPPLSQLINMKELSLSGIGLSGSIPSWFAYLKQLHMVDLSHNKFTGVIPNSLWTLPHLNVLILNDNSLSGPLPVSGGDQLTLLTVFHNKIQDQKFDDAVCRNHISSNSNNTSSSVGVVSADCGSGCTKGCCGECCPAGSESCAAAAIDKYTSGLDFTVTAYAFDPSILNENGVGKYNLTTVLSNPIIGPP